MVTREEQLNELLALIDKYNSSHTADDEAYEEIVTLITEMQNATGELPSLVVRWLVHEANRRKPGLTVHKRIAKERDFAYAAVYYTAKYQGVKGDGIIDAMMGYFDISEENYESFRTAVFRAKRKFSNSAPAFAKVAVNMVKPLFPSSDN